MTRKKGCVLFFFALVIGIICLRIFDTQAYAFQSGSIAKNEVTSDSIKEKQDAIEKAKKEKNRLESGLTDVKKVIEGLETDKDDLETYVRKLDENLAQVEQNIKDLEQQITDKQAEIETTKQELEEAQEVQDAQYESMKERIKFIYESQTDVVWEILFTSGSFSELLNKADYIEQLSAYDRNMLNNYIEICQEISLTQEQLELEESILEQSQQAVEEEKAALDELIAAKKEEIERYESDISNREALVKQYQDEITAQENEIKALEQAVAEEKKRMAQAALTRTYDGGTFIWPCPSYTRISDDYGYRIHPTLLVQQFHNGVDMAAPTGSAILAAYDGDVISASYSSTMGNYVMIDHGNNLYTIYMHASELYVSTGDSVKRGDKIAAVGSTGRSTGPHLHFSVRLNGAYVSPWNYIINPNG